MPLVTNPFGHRNLLSFRTESLFYVPERRKLAVEWNHLRYTRLPYPREPNLRNTSLRKPLPFTDATFDHTYCFHVAEHLSYDHGSRFVRELHRVTRPGGICRLSTPDLAFFAEDYLHWLKQYEAQPTREHFQKYQWALLNIIDQAVREESGGRMGPVLGQRDYDPDHLRDLNGDLLEFLSDPALADASTPRARLATIGRYIDGSSAGAWFTARRIAAVLSHKLINRLSPRLYLFLTRENNRWYYDPVSLRQQFEQAGFQNITFKAHDTSDIPGWERYNFDQSALGPHALEPSLYIEGRKA